MSTNSNPISRATPTRNMEALRQLGDQLSRVWLIPFISGLISFGLGLAILATDWTIQALVILAGVLFVVRGLSLAFSPEHVKATVGEHIAAGILAIVAGFVLIAWPGPTLLVLAFFVGAWLAVSGAFHVIVAIARRRELPHWGTTLAIGIVELPLGVWAMRRPDVTFNIMVTVLGLWTIVTGVILVIQSLEIRRDVRAVQATVRTAPLDERVERFERLRANGLLTDDEFAQLTATAAPHDGRT